jgi:hypothetical protein
VVVVGVEWWRGEGDYRENFAVVLRPMWRCALTPPASCCPPQQPKHAGESCTSFARPALPSAALYSTAIGWILSLREPPEGLASLRGADVEQPPAPPSPRQMHWHLSELFRTPILTLGHPVRNTSSTATELQGMRATSTEGRRLPGALHAGDEHCAPPVYF